MLPFAHAGITLGLAVITASIQNSLSSPGKLLTEAANNTVTTDPPVKKKDWLYTLSRYGDLRFLILGSLISDIIDKPLGLWLIGSGKFVCHTLLFLILISTIGWYLWHIKKRNWLLLISAGTLTHLLLDRMWRWPRVFFWPLYGWTFPRGILEQWLPNIWHTLLTEPAVYIPEIIGFIVFICFGLILLRRKQLFPFIKYGRI